MTTKQKRKIKIRVKAGACLALESVLIYNLFGTVGTSFKVGFKNTLHEMNYSTYNFLTERKSDTLNVLGQNIATTLKVDLLDMNNAIKTIEQCPNLKYLEIYNAQKTSYTLTELINKMGLTEVRLVFDKNDTIRLMNEGKKYDLNFYDDKSIIKSISFYEDDRSEEFDNVLFLNYITNYEGLDLEFTKDKYLDDYLDEMVNTISLDRKHPQVWENLVNLVDYTRSYLEYDPEVLEFTKNTCYKDYKKKNKKLYNRMEEYNDNTFSSILDGDKARILDPSRQVKGLCANYQALFTMLCLKSGIECYPISGYHTNDFVSKAPHGWNLIKINNAYYIIDVTRFDSFESCNELMDTYLKDNSYENFTNVLSSILIPIKTDIAKEYEENLSTDAIINGVMINKTKQINNRVYGSDVTKETYGNFGRDGIYLFLLLNCIAAINYERKKDKKRKQKSLQKKVSYGTI